LVGAIIRSTNRRPTHHNEAKIVRLLKEEDWARGPGEGDRIVNACQFVGLAMNIALLMTLLLTSSRQMRAAFMFTKFWVDMNYRVHLFHIEIISMQLSSINCLFHSHKMLRVVRKILMMYLLLARFNLSLKRLNTLRLRNDSVKGSGGSTQPSDLSTAFFQPAQFRSLSAASIAG
jgi:hypothetical protein